MTLRWAAVLVLIAITTWVGPALVIRALVPVLEDGRRGVENHRGRPVFLGLGIVWIVWAAGTRVALAVMHIADSIAVSGSGRFTGGAVGALLVSMPVVLVVGAGAFGLFDDLIGSNEVRGFRGHLSSLRRGRLTTGGLKFLGIGALSAAAAADIVANHEMSAATSASWVLRSAWVVGIWVCATLVIALSANLVNLLDLRPGRALKAYSVLAVPAAFGMAWIVAVGIWRVSDPWYSAPVETFLLTAASLLIVLGPVAAVWRYDIGERGMLGDAGANAAGALAGYLLAQVLPLWGLALAAVVLLELNRSSERVSFSAVIERTPLLRAIDRLGRGSDVP
ncbi:MAG: hypothetical protein WC971_01105 [Coriobacteriia bacterium]